MNLYFNETVLMKPLQFSQKKKDINWLALKSWPSVTKLESDLINIRKKSWATKESLRTRSAIQSTAEALYDYYKLLFSPEAKQSTIWTDTSQGPAIKDPSRLFPTWESILINPDTNFILLPFQFPTYHKRTQNRYWVPLLNPHIQRQDIDEWIHQMDYSTDNIYATRERRPSQQNIKNYPHLNPLIKHDLLLNSMDIWYRIRVYQYIDISDEVRKKLNIKAPYSLKDIQPEKVEEIKLESRRAKRHKPLESPDNSEEETFSWINAINDLNSSWRNITIFTRRQLTLLEITSPLENKLYKDRLRTHIRLDSYAKDYLTWNPFVMKPIYFNFYNSEYWDEALKPRIIEYFMDNIQCCQFSTIEIKAGIRKLQNKITYDFNHPNSSLHSNETK